jgi:hypothetical protein
MGRFEGTKARIRATYEDSEVFFDLPRSATLEHLAATLVAVGRGHGAPVTVEVFVDRSEVSLQPAKATPSAIGRAFDAAAG